MDVDELARIEETLLAAIAEAKAVLKATGVGPQFRQIVRHAREMHDILLETLRADGQIGSCPLRCQATEIKSRYHEWEIIGPPQIRRVASASTFSAWRKPSNRVVHRPTAEEPTPNEQPMFVRHLGQEMNAAVSESSAYLRGLTARATITASSGLLRLTGGNHERKMTHRRPKVFLERFFNRIGQKLPLQKTVHFCRKRTYILRHHGQRAGNHNASWPRCADTTSNGAAAPAGTLETH